MCHKCKFFVCVIQLYKEKGYTAFSGVHRGAGGGAGGGLLLSEFSLSAKSFFKLQSCSSLYMQEGKRIMLNLSLHKTFSFRRERFLLQIFDTAQS